MRSYICICNPVRVWDYAGFFATPREVGYWVFPKTTFRQVSENDTLYLRVTQADKLPGVYAKFSITGKRTGVCPKEFWRVGAYPQDLQYLVDFESGEYFPTQRITPDDMKMAGVSANSPLLRVPQAKAAEIEARDAAILENLIARRHQNITQRGIKNVAIGPYGMHGAKSGPAISLSPFISKFTMALGLAVGCNSIKSWLPPAISRIKEVDRFLESLRSTRWIARADSCGIV